MPPRSTLPPTPAGDLEIKVYPTNGGSYVVDEAGIPQPVTVPDAAAAADAPTQPPLTSPNEVPQ